LTDVEKEPEITTINVYLPRKAGLPPGGACEQSLLGESIHSSCNTNQGVWYYSELMPSEW